MRRAMRAVLAMTMANTDRQTNPLHGRKWCIAAVMADMFRGLTSALPPAHMSLNISSPIASIDG